MEMGDGRIASPVPFDEIPHCSGRKSDAEDASPAASSNYSSCEGSEFDKYCSANSLLGSASICSSVGNRGEFLDSSRSAGFGEDCVLEDSTVRGKFLKNCSSGDVTDSGRYDCSSDWGIESPRENGIVGDQVLFLDSEKGADKNLYLSVVDAEKEDEKLTGSRFRESFPFLASQVDTGVVNNNKNSGETSWQCPSAPEDNHNLNEKLGFSFHGSTSDYHVQIGSVPDEDTSSRCEHSEGEDSMLDSGTDEEDRIHLHGKKLLQHFQEARSENQNPLLMSSAVAFGNDDWDEFVQETEGNGLGFLSLYGDKPPKPQHNDLETEENILTTPDSNSMVYSDVPTTDGIKKAEGVGDILIARCQVSCGNESIGNSVSCPIRKLLAEDKGVCAQKPLCSPEDSHADEGNVIVSDCATEKELSTKEVAGVDGDETSERLLFGEGELSLTHKSNTTASQFYAASAKAFQVKETRSLEELKPTVVLPRTENGHDYTDMHEEIVATNEVEKLGKNESYDEMVLEMEEILLDSGDSHGARFTQGSQGYISQQSHHFRDGSSTASTSGKDDAYPMIHSPPKIDWVEVVGAKQKKGDVSFGERLVGVKEYTVYILRVWSGKDQWEVERRYRDFFTLYRQLKILFTDHGLALPSPWFSVEQESRKIFGNASPNVISERSTLIQDCLHSILHYRPPFGTPSSLVWFLLPTKALNNSGFLNTLLPQSLQKLDDDVKSTSSYYGESCTDDIPSLGKTISLVVEVKVCKSMRQLLEAQYYTCAGCHRHLDAGKTLMQEFVQTLGWGKPRLCEYTGQLFCSSCHTNDTAVLPARVLHHWDFSLYPVSQLAKAYLESIYEQPMLCVSAVNPFLFSKVPALLHVMGVRKKIGAMLPYVRCPFQRSIHRGLGPRRYLLESNDFFALRDLVDLSKGAFAALPVLVETVSSKILDHITLQCLVCYDAGVPCAARQACKDPSSYIFPFQEAETARCSSCDSAFHKPCIENLGGCPCCKSAAVDNRAEHAERTNHAVDIELDGVLDMPPQKPNSNSTAIFFSDLLAKARPDKLWKPRNRNPVILMGSLPSTSL